MTQNCQTDMDEIENHQLKPNFGDSLPTGTMRMTVNEFELKIKQAKNDYYQHYKSE